MTTGHIMLTIATDETGTKCSPECHGFSGRDGGPWCEVFRDALEYAVIPARHTACIEAERAALEAEIEALHEGWDLASCNGDPQALLRDRVGALKMLEVKS
jgi:hypothetical protein